MRLARLACLVCLLSAGLSFASEPPRVVVSIKPIHSLVAGLMKGVGEPDLLVKGKTTPYRYRLTAEARDRIEAADLLVWVGRELEPYLVEPAAARSSSAVIEMLSLDALKILPQRDRPGLRDPYFWLDTRNALIAINLLTAALSELDPARAHLYRNNHRELRRQLQEIDRAFEYGYRGVSGRPVLLYHDTQQYFEQAYAMRPLGYLTEAVGQTADAALLLKNRQVLGEAASAVCLLTEIGLPATNLDLLQSRHGVRRVALDSHGVEFTAGPGLYRALMRHNFDAIQRCFHQGK